MPLHLLGKKSWNVYNADNIARVRRDEAAAAAKEAAEEQRMQEEDAQRRIALLRGEAVPPLAEEEPTPAPDQETHRRTEDRPGRERKRRRLRGEDDTERDIRVAREDQALATEARTAAGHPRTSDAPITDERGHIALFAPEAAKQQPAKSKGKKGDTQKEETEQAYGMRFVDAAGFKQDARTAPWYSATTTTEKKETAVGRDVWGNEDPRRHERERTRQVASDPLLAIQQGVQGVRRAAKEKERWKEERRRDVDDLIREEKKEARRERQRTGETEEERRERKERHRRHRRDRDRERERGHAGEHPHRHDRRHRRRDESEDSLEGFRLDDHNVHRDRGQDATHRRKRSRSPGGERDRRHHRRSERA